MKKLLYLLRCVYGTWGSTWYTSDFQLLAADV